MRPTSVLLALAALLVRSAHGAAADLEKDGFKQDGKTTYCQGVHGEQGPLVFEELATSSVGKCPVDVTMTLSSTSIPTVDTRVSVTWSAGRAPGDAASSLFPRAVNETTGVPQNIIASLLRACKAGSNCAKDSDVVVPAAAGESAAGDSLGAFDAQGKKQLRTFEFQFPATGKYIVVGKIVLPGDAALNISATEFVTFQSVQVGGSSSEAPGTVKPSDSSAIKDSEANGVLMTKSSASSETETSSHLDVKAQDAKGAGMGDGTSSSSSGGSKTNAILLSAVAGVGVAVAAAYFVTAKRAKEARDAGRKQGVDETSIYTLNDASATASMTPIGSRRQSQQSNRFLAQEYQHAKAQSQHSSVYHSTRQPSARRPTSSGFRETQEPRQTRVASIDPPALSREDLGGTTPDFGNLEADESLFESQMTSFGGLHDSAIALPVESNRGRQFPAESYINVSVDFGDDFESFKETDLSASEIPSTRRAPPPPAMTHSMRPSEIADIQSTNRFDESTYSWVYSERDTDLSLSSIHEPKK